MRKIKSIFVDMDGVIAEWRTDKTVKDTYEKGYFKNLRPYENVLQAIKEINEMYPEISVNILSAVGADNSFAMDDKRDWLKRYLPEIADENIFFVFCGCRKSVVCPGMTENDILIDDYNNNLEDWAEHGGTTIKIYNGVNSPTSNKHYVIDKNKKAEEIVLEILDAIDILSCTQQIVA